MVYSTYNELVNGVYKPIYSVWGHHIVDMYTYPAPKQTQLLTSYLCLPVSILSCSMRCRRPPTWNSHLCTTPEYCLNVDRHQSGGILFEYQTSFHVLLRG